LQLTNSNENENNLFEQSQTMKINNFQTSYPSKRFETGSTLSSFRFSFG